MTADVKNFYLNTPIDRPEYMRIALKKEPDEIIQEYNVMDLIHEEYVYCKIVTGMYGLPRAGRLANQLLKKRLKPHGYSPAPQTHGLWRNNKKPKQFTLVVDDFGIKYEERKDAEELAQVLKDHYEAVSGDWGGYFILRNRPWLGLRQENSWPQHARIHRKGTTQVPAPTSQNTGAPAAGHNQPQYGVKVQMTEPADASPLLDEIGIKELMAIVGSLLYYGRALDNTLLTALTDLSSAQAKGTEATNATARKLLDYCATHPDAEIRYHGSQMALKMHSDASYLSASKDTSTSETTSSHPTHTCTMAPYSPSQIF
jgi:hypothetical protein